MKKNRESNFELLRILSMFLIVVAHCVYYTEFTFDNDIQLNLILTKILRIGAKIGVNCFVLITGYFMVNSKFKIKKVILLELKILTYTLSILIINYIFKFSEIKLSLLIKSILPITFEMYWFMTTYMLLYIISPFLNKYINHSSRKDLLQLILVLLLIKVIIPTLTTSELGLSNLSWFICLYFIGAYIKLYNIQILEYKNLNRLLFIGNLLFIILTTILITILSINYKKLIGHENYFAIMNKVPLVICSITLFYIFKNINVQNQFINIMSKNMLGVYLIHENEMLRDLIWNKIFKIYDFSNSNLLIIYILLYCILIIVVCTFIDKFIDLIINQIYKLLTKIYNINFINKSVMNIKSKIIKG